MKRKISILCMMFMLTSLFYACSDKTAEFLQVQNVINGNEELLIPTTATLVNEKSVVQSEDPEVVEAEEFAKLLATAINSKDVRKFLKDEANKKFDGDFDILVSKVLDSKIGQLTFKNKIEQSSSLGSSKGKEVFEKAIKNPKLNISVPIQIENWNESKQQLLVAVGIGTIEGETKFVKAFDSKGRIYLIDFNIDPDVPVIVVGNNERMNNQKGNKNGAIDNQKSTLIATRTNGRYERVTFIKCTDLNAIEDWTRGNPEIQFDGIIYEGGAASNACSGYQAESSSRDKAKAGWNPNLELFQWFFATSQGDNYYLHAIEIDDNGTTIKIPISLSGSIGDVIKIPFTIGFELTYKAGDDKLPSRQISYESDNPQWLSDSRIQMKIQNY